MIVIVMRVLSKTVISEEEQVEKDDEDNGKNLGVDLVVIFKYWV